MTDRVSFVLYLLLLAAVGGERLVELAVSRRNARWARMHGGVETGRRHFRAIALAHAAFLPACAAEVWLLERPFLPLLGIPMLAVALGAQALRWWAARSLGRSWNVRVIVVPGLPAVERGPYRWLRHPNYAALIAEGVALPLVHTAWLTALLFTAGNALLLRARVACEEQALSEHTDWGRRFARRRRFLPSLRTEGP